MWPIWTSTGARWIGGPKCFFREYLICINVRLSLKWKKLLSLLGPYFLPSFTTIAPGNLDYPLALYVVDSSLACFRLNSTVRSETKGIWMWCVPHSTKKKHTLILLDTEGLRDVKKVRQGVENPSLLLPINSPPQFKFCDIFPQIASANYG